MKKFLLLASLLIVMLSAMAQDLSLNQLVYYPFDGNANNAAASGINNGTAVGAVLVDGFDGATNSAYSFDGINDQILFGDIDLTTESFSISFWIKLPEVDRGSVSYRILSQRSVCSIGNLFDIAYSNTTTYGYAIGMEMYGGASNVSGHVNTGAMENPHAWNHITFTKDNDTKTSKCYLNGKLVNNTNWTIPANTDFSLNSTAQLGVSNSPCINNTSTKYFNGMLDELRIHTRVITEQEMNIIVPFMMESNFPAADATGASITSGIVLNFTRNLNSSTVNATNISASGATSGALTPIFTGSSTSTVTIDFTGGLPAGEEITVSVSGVESADGASMTSQSFLFTTATEEEALRAYYDLSGAITDKSGYGNDLTFNGSSPAFITDRLKEAGGALTLNSQIFLYSGTTGYESLEFGLHQDFTIGFWIKAAQENRIRPILEQIGAPVVNVSLNASGQVSFKLTDANNTQELVTTNRYDDNLWNHITITADRNNEYRIYVNGMLAASQAVGASFNLLNYNPWYINFSPTNTLRYNGQLDDIKFYNNCLTQAEVKALAPVHEFISPLDGDIAIRKDPKFIFEYGQKVSVASLVTGNFSLTGSVSGAKTFTFQGGDSRIFTLIPDTDFVLDETVTLTYSNLQIENGDLLSGTLNYETADVYKGMLFYYPMNGDATNAVGDNYDGIVTGATLTEGFDGTVDGAYSFGGNANIDVAVLGLDTESYAMAFWMKRNDTKARVEIAGQRNGCTGNPFMELSSPWNPYNNKYEVVLANSEIVGGFNSYFVRTEIEPNVWTHIVAERDAQDGKLRIYKNGSLVQEVNFDGAYSINNTKSFALGNGNGCVNVDGRLAYNGDLDEFRFYRRSIDPLEVDQLVDFRFEGSIPQHNATAVSATSNFILDFNQDINSNSFSSGNISITTSGGAALDYTVSLKGDSIIIKPDHAWPAGKTLIVNATGITSDTGESVSRSIAFTIATVEESLVLHLPLDGSTNDNSLFTHAVSSQAAFAYAENRFKQTNKAVNFNNGRNSLKIAAASEDLSNMNFGVNNDFTISTWFNTGVASGGRSQMIYSRISNTIKLQALIMGGGNLQLIINDGTSVQYVQTSGQIRFDDSKWHYAAFSADRDGTINIYVDGKLAASENAQPININVLGDITIGGIFSGLDQDYMRGRMDDLRVYNRSFTLQEMEEIAPFYVAVQPFDGTDAIELNQTFTMELLRPVSTATAISGNFTVTGAASGAHTAVITGGGTRNLTINPDTDFMQDEEVTVSFSGLEDTDGNPIPDRTFNFETFNINKGMYVFYPFLGDAKNQAMNQYDGVVNGATLVDDRNGNPNSAYSFDGGDYIDIGNLPLSSQSFSISFWFKRDAVQEQQLLAGQRAACNGSNQVNVGCSYSSTTDSYAIGLSLGTTIFGSFQAASVSAPIQTDTWTHVSLVRDNATGLLKLYLNGNLEAVQTFNLAYNISNAASFGLSSGSACINVDATRRFTGDLDEFRIYNRAITADEATQLPNLVIEPPVVAETAIDKTIDEDAGPTSLYDLSTLFTSTLALDYSVTSSNPAIDAYIDGQMLIVNPDADYFGFSEIAMTAFNGISVSQTFNVDVLSINDAPAFDLSHESLVLTKNFTESITVTLEDFSPANESDQVITYSLDPISVNFANIGFNSSTGAISIDPIADGLGNQVFTITADDGEGASNTYSKTFSLEVVDNLPPLIVTAVSDATLDEDGTTILSNNVSAVFSDGNNDALTYSTNSDEAGVIPSIANNQLTITLAPNFNGSATISLTASDGKASVTDEILVTVNPVNDAPIVDNAVVDLNTNEDDLFSYSLPVDQFSDIDGDNLTIQEVVFTGQNGISGSWLAFNSETNTISGIPLQSHVGTTTVNVTATDGSLTVTDAFDVVVINVNDVPVASNQPTQSLTEDGQPINIDIATIFSDEDGDVLTYTYSIIENTLIVDLALTGSTLIITPLGDANGTQTITLTAADASLSVSTALTVTISPVNDAPRVKNAVNDQTTTEGTAFTLTLPADEFGDPEMDAISISVLFNGQNGTDGSWLSFDAQTNTISGTPAQANVGITIVTVTATDGSLSSSDVFLITVADVNTLPVVVSSPMMSFVEDGAAQTLDLSTLFSDADQDILSYTVTYLENPLIANYGESGGLLTVTPIADLNGNQTIRITASDNVGSVTYDLPVSISAVNDAPILNVAIPNQVALEGSPFSYTIPANTFSDVDGDNLTISVSGQPAWLSFDVQTQTLSGTPANENVGTFVLNVSASDGQISTNQSVSFIVENVNDLPMIISQPSLIFDEDGAAQTIDLTTLFSDDDGDALTFTLAAPKSEVPFIVNASISGNILTVTPVADANGSMSLGVLANDGSLESGISYDLPVSIAAINDAPAFSLSENQISLEQDFAGTQTVNILAGAVPFNETDQIVTYTVTPNDGSLVNIGISGTSLNITAVAGASGTATFTITASETSEVNGTFTQTLTITINKALALNGDLVLSIFPNPASDFVMVQSKATLNISIFNLNGGLIRSGVSNQLIEVRDLDSGVYLIQTMDENKKSTIDKLIIK